jgi:hypothetical protein
VLLDVSITEGSFLTKDVVSVREVKSQEILPARSSDFDNIDDSHHFLQLPHRFCKKFIQSCDMFIFIACYAFGLKFKFVLDRNISVPYSEQGNVVPLQRGSFFVKMPSKPFYATFKILLNSITNGIDPIQAKHKFLYGTLKLKDIFPLRNSVTDRIGAFQAKCKLVNRTMRLTVLFLRISSTSLCNNSGV